MSWWLKESTGFQRICCQLRVMLTARLSNVFSTVCWDCCPFPSEGPCFKLKHTEERCNIFFHSMKIKLVEEVAFVAFFLFFGLDSFIFNCRNSGNTTFLITTFPFNKLCLLNFHHRSAHVMLF